MARDPSFPRSAAGIVAFGPDRARLSALIDAVEPAVGRVFVYINGLAGEDVRSDLAARAGVRVIASPFNQGVGTALDALAAAARAEDFHRILLFDQDSRPRSALPAALEAALDRLEAEGHRPAAVGPRLVAPAERPDYKSPHYPRRPGQRPPQGLTAVEFLATSGTLLDLAAYGAVGPFREDFFIDAIDLEWGFRAWDRGWSVWRVDEATMEHTVGSGAIRFLGLVMPDQRPFRMYAYLRNNAYGFRLPHVPLRWKLRQGPYLAFQALAYAWHHRFDRRVLAALAGGVWAGLRGRLGPPPGAALTGPADPRSRPPGSDAGRHGDPAPG